jgi:two-component system CheB/CheR fusion protein
MFSEEMERKVNERTVLLKTANIDLEHSNKNLEQFAFIASHDLQEPLRKIKTFTKLLSDNFDAKLPDEAKKLLERIHSSSQRMSVLIQDVLDFSMIDNSGNLFVETDLNDIFKKVVNDFALLIAEKGGTIECEKLPTLEVVAVQINQLFYNLLSNALKFTREKNPPVIKVTSLMLSPKRVLQHPDLDPRLSYYEIVFADNGIGFNNKYADEIFAIFKRLHTSNQFPGTGIGLALCMKIALNHHGTMYAEGLEGTSATFHIILPVTQALSPLDLAGEIWAK